MEELKHLLNSNLLPLAFLGDAVHTLFVRENILKNGLDKMDSYHSKSSAQCKAESQARALKNVESVLSEEEKEIVRRARNAKAKHHAKNASVEDYSHATAFEALIGYLYISKQSERLEEILNLSLKKD